MKRKRGHKKGKSKKPPVVGPNEAYVNVVSLNTEDNSGLDDFDNAEYDSVMEVDTPSSTGTDQPDKLANINPDGSVDKRVGQSVYGRVKVKLRTSKMLESQPTSSDAPTQSDTDKSSQQMGLEKQAGITEKVEDSANSIPQMKIAASGNPSKKAGSIKIKSSRSLGSASINQISSVVGERPPQKESMIPRQDPRYNKEELKAALMVIKKVMKMDAAEPFNVPVNPIALGIPDYFDVIDTPMDFGTIFCNLENGVKYMNSEDVFKDVQYIWENCYKYNNKGDYIVDLMKRVKKNFTKYWTAAGLYSEQQQRMNGVESIQAEDIAPSSQGKVQVKGGHAKQKTRKRHGVKRHKDGCLCAICVLKRRRRERENAQIVEDQVGASDNNLALGFKQEETSPVESPCDEDTSSNMDNSLDPDSEADLEEKGEEVKSETTERQHSPQLEKQEEKANEMVIQKKSEGETPEQSQLGDGSGEEPTRQSQTQIVEESGAGFETDTLKEKMTVHDEEENSAVQQQRLKESQEKHKKSKIYENFRFENPMLLKLCGTLFPENPRSVWSGPHSLVQQQGSGRSSSIHAAIATFMK